MAEFTLAKAIGMQEDLIRCYLSPEFTEALHKGHADAAGDAKKQKQAMTDATMNHAQSKVFPKYGFEASAKGRMASLGAYGPHNNDPIVGRNNWIMSYLTTVEMQAESMEAVMTKMAGPDAAKDVVAFVEGLRGGAPASTPAAPQAIENGYPLYIKTRKQEIINFNVEEDTTVAEVQKTVQDKLGIPLYDQPPLFFNGVELKDEGSTLGSLQIIRDQCPGGPMLELGRSPYAPYHVLIELPNGKDFKAFVDPKFTCAQMKALLTAECGIPYLMIKLSFQGNELTAESKTMEAYGIGPNTKLLCKTLKPLYAGPQASK